MDAFYAAVEVHDDPTLAGRPLIVGGNGPRGVVASCSYEARAFGVRSAMPSAQARRLCPRAVFLAGHYDRYAEVSRAIHRIFEAYTPLVEGIALDEAFLDVSGAIRLFGPTAKIADGIRAQIGEELGLSCSVGVAASKFVAKLASEAAKPHAALAGTVPGLGVVVVAPGEELAFLHPLPVEALWGVGPATATRLRRLGVGTVGQLAAVPIAALEASVGRAHGHHLHQLAHAVDPRRVSPDRVTKSVGHEETWAYDRYDATEMHAAAVRMADAVASRLRKSGFVGRTVTLKVRFGDFTMITRSHTLPRPADTGAALARVATGLLERVDCSPGVRLLGVSVSSLAGPAGVGSEQLAFDIEDPTGAASGPSASGPPPSRPPPSGPPASRASAAGPLAPRPSAPRPSPSECAEAWRAATGAMDEARRRFGEAAVGPAAAMGEPGLPLGRPGGNRWGPAARDDDARRSDPHGARAGADHRARPAAD